MSDSATARPAVASALQDAAIVWGTEILLVGWLVALVAGRVGPGAVVGLGAALLATSAVASVALERSRWRPTGRAILALCLSFLSMLPGIFFFIELQTRSATFCYDRPWSHASFTALVGGPALVVISLLVSPWRARSISLTIIRALHALVWLLGAGNTLMCGMTV